MKKNIILLVGIILCFQFFANAQTSASNFKTTKVAIFAPLYLDSVFNENGNYKYNKNFPKFIQQGLDFVQGAQIALDSIPLPNGNIQSYIYDSKAYVQNIGWLIQNHKLDSIDVIIGAVKDAEFTDLANFAKGKNIPFISATYPNDGGITANPFLVILNSTLKTHCEAIYSYVLQNHGNDKIYLCRKKGAQEDKIANYIKQINEVDGKPLLNIQTLNFEDDFTTLQNKLDSNKKSIIIAASLNEDFAQAISEAAYSLKKSYAIQLIGMPNWDGFAALKKANLKDFAILYTTPYTNTKTDDFSKRVQNIYSKKFKGVPSDMTYKGYETAYLFSRLISRYPNDFMSHLNEYAYKVFNDYNFQPIYLSKKSSIPDYFENKHLYFMKIINGKILKAW